MRWRMQMRKTCEFALDARLHSLHQDSAQGTAVSGDEANIRRSRHLLARAAVEAQEAIMNGTLVSRNCHVSLRVNASTYHLEKQYAKAVNYTLLVTGLSLIQVHHSRPSPGLQPPGSCFRPAPSSCGLAAALASLQT